MRKTLLRKVIVSYFIILSISFFILMTVTYKIVENHLITEKKELLKKEATILANQYISAYNSGSMNSFDISYLITILDQSLDTRIWFANRHGELVLDSRNEIAPYRNINLHSLNDEIIYKHSSSTGDFYGFFNGEFISVGIPIMTKSAYQGSIFLHYDILTIKEKSSIIYTLGLITLIITMIISVSFIIYFGNKIVKPINDMNDAALKYANGDFDTTLTVNTNDEIGQLATSLNTMAFELSKMEELRRSFIANISHDFRSPLTSIKGYVGAILDGTISAQHQDKYLNIVYDETERLNKLTSDILFLTKMETSGLNLNYRTFDIHSVIRKVTALFEQKCLNKNIKVTLMLDKEELLVFADIDKIQQVLHNLFDNAVKFSYENSYITIETTQLREKVYVSINDTGEGIPCENLKYIWDRFYKSDPSRGKDKNGTGLGLSIVREIIKAHNENIRVFSTKGKGTEFVFTLLKSS
ncbi:signal transduction histidine kinase [Natranaerovirga pectinivora]|uniref:histidine kinase n=1 Tax=Natranaerovirga pectinivora TaxID=682400 RepID=A0A4R3MF84_9FIRM|nr:HAMP domain-containing sensor histidine kinase [Natranaerovirga pectinivora]TCT12180.1 signal transduction histidine kinase [Natranaerovirga pectinivora]